MDGRLPANGNGARVRRSSGNLTVTDGPFTESKEVVGGFAILKANSKEEAIELAREFLQAAGEGECELRQLYEPNAMIRATQLSPVGVLRQKAEHGVIGSCEGYRYTSRD